MNAGKYELLAQAKIDLSERSSYLIENASDRVMLRFIRSVFSTASLLSGFPSAGTKCLVGKKELAGLRRFPVKGFRNITIFYLPAESGIVVLRIVHSRRDLSRIWD